MSDPDSFWRYSWDYENRMTQAVSRKQTVRYKYDALGRRVAQYAGAKGQTKFTYDGPDVLLDDFNGTLTKYINGLGIDNKLRQTISSTASYFLADHLSSTNGLADSTGSLTSSTLYDSFGNATNPSFPTRYQFTGREQDPVTGLQYNRARWYDASIGRFISEDPIGFRGGDINLYGYVGNKPLRFRDPKGLFPDADVLSDPNAARAAAAAAGALGGYAAVAAPPVTVAVVGGAAIYGAWQLGQSLAANPSNPFVYGPLNPFGEPYPIEPPLPSKATPRPTCQPVPKAIPWTNNWPPIRYPIPLGPYPPINPEQREDCVQKCAHLLGIGDNGVQYLACYRRCVGTID
jgi:RHS repeat-associated protein